MKNKFTITISDVKGSKHYTLHQIVKKFLLYLMLGSAFLFLSGGVYIYVLSKNISKLEEKRALLIKEQENMLEENKKLEQRNLHTTEELESVQTQVLELESVYEKMKEIEQMLGIEPSDQIQTEQRIEKITLTGIQQNYLLRSIPSGSVLEKTEVTAKFGQRVHPIKKEKEFHRGIDLRAADGTPVFAPADGVVEYVGFHKDSGYGNLLILNHNFGFKTFYAHLNKKEVLKKAQVVKKGDLIAYTGNTGTSTGPHLHYEILFITIPINPINFLNWSNANFEEIFKKEKIVPWQSLIEMTAIQAPPQQQQ